MFCINSNIYKLKVLLSLLASLLLAYLWDKVISKNMINSVWQQYYQIKKSSQLKTTPTHLTMTQRDRKVLFFLSHLLSWTPFWWEKKTPLRNCVDVTSGRFSEQIGNPKLSEFPQHQTVKPESVSRRLHHLRWFIKLYLIST